MQAVAGKLKKKTDITAEKIVTDKPLEFGRVVDEEEEEEAAARLPGEEIWEREALISTKSEPSLTMTDVTEIWTTLPSSQKGDLTHLCGTKGH